MQAHLAYGHKVEIDPRARQIGGCWQGEMVNNLPTLWNLEEFTFFYNRLHEKQDVVLLDIGSNTGAFSMLAVTKPDMISHAFEPSPITYEVLESNVSLNGMQGRIKTYPFALSNQNGTTILKYPKDNKSSGMACIGTPKRFDEWDEYTVQMRRLDDISENLNIHSIDLIKIDTEGCELLVLKGAEGIIQQNHPDILCECHELNASQFGYHPVEILKLMTSWGYRYSVVSHEDIFFYWPKV
jgi:FkbM family methyltransferase